MGILSSVSVEEIRDRGSIRDGDVARLQRALRELPAISAEEADQLLALDAACPVKDPAWFPFLVDLITDYIVCQAKPEGYMVAAKSDWLIERLSSHGQIAGSVGYDLLVSVISRARWSPTSLIVFSLGQIKAGIESGTGPHRSGLSLPAGAISQAEIDRIGHLLVAFGGDSGLPVTRAEVDVLVDINRALQPGQSSPAWSDLFVKAVGNAVLAGLGLAALDRATALGIEAWPALATLLRSEPGGGRGGDPGTSRVWSTCRLLSAEERALQRLERQRSEIVTGEPIEEADEAWLLARLGGDARLDQNEAALLAFIEREAVSLPRSVKLLVQRATLAA